MAAPHKKGLQYFPLDIDLDQDDKLQMVIAVHDYPGELIFTKLCGFLYKTGGYSIEWNEQNQLKFAQRIAYTKLTNLKLILDVVQTCVKWGLFNKELFTKYNILTSERIQKTWLEATRKRKDRDFDNDIWLVEMAKPERLIPEQTEQTPPETHQETPQEPEVKKPKKTLQEKQAECKQRMKVFYETLAPYVKQYSKEMVRAFYDYWSEPNKGETKMKMEFEPTWNLEARLRKWESNDYKYKNKKSNTDAKTTEQKQSEFDRLLQEQRKKLAADA